MFVLHVLINVPTRAQRKKKSATDRIILNPELQGSKTQVFKPIFSHHFGQTLHLQHGSLQQKNLKQNKKVYIRIKTLQ